MQKIPTLFKRNGEFSVYNEVNPGCEWVLAGEGKPTWKFDGTCCMIQDGKLFKRREVKPGQVIPKDFIQAGVDKGKLLGWVPVEFTDKYHHEAFARRQVWEDGTYELVGPKVNNNREKESVHSLVPHGQSELYHVPRDFKGLKLYLDTFVGEGIVWWHSDGRKVKLKRKDFNYDT